MKNTANRIRTICEMGIFAALGFVLDELQGLIFGGVFPSGGSIGFAMIAVLIIAYRRGLLPALGTGLIMGLFDIATKAYVLHPAQVLLDYILPYTLVGLAGLFKPLFDESNSRNFKMVWLIVGTVVGGLLKFASHYLAGVIYWGDPEYFAWNLNWMNKFLYSFVYNIAFVGPSIVLTAALLVVLFVVSPKILTNAPIVEEVESNRKSNVPVIISYALIAVGAFLFVFFFIDWIRSFYYKASGPKYYFNQDSMVIYVIGIFFVVLGVIGLISFFKNKYNYLVLSSTLLAVSVVSLLYSVTKLGEAYVDQEDPTKYWIWFPIALVGVIGVSIFFALTIINNKKNKQQNA